jgi:RHS repeat-associated protein
VSTTGPTGNTTASYTYDHAGNTLTNTTGAATQTSTYDDSDRVATTTDASGTSSYVYDAAGNRLLTRAPTGTTLTIGDLELFVPAGTNTAAGPRFDPYNGQHIAERTQSAGLTWLLTDTSGTAYAAVNSVNLAVTERWQDPYGSPRGTVPTNWPDQHGFLGDLRGSDGLVHVGARDYDPATGRFTSVDPLLDSSNPQQMNGYSYADDNAVTLSDPTGTDPIPNCPIGDVACFNCSYSGDCSAPGSDGGGGDVPPGTPTINPCWGDCGTVYTPITPHVRVASNDSRLKGMTAAWNAWLKIHNMPSDWQPGSANQELAIWYQLCDEGYGDIHANCGGSFDSELFQTYNNWSGMPSKLAAIAAAGGSAFLDPGTGSGASNEDPGTGSEASNENAGRTVVRSLSDPQSMVGATLEQVRALIPDGWIEVPMKKGTGVRWLEPGGRSPGSRGYVEYVIGGSPGVKGPDGKLDPLHNGGNYSKLMIGGLQYRSAGDGNAVAGDPAAAVSIQEQGSTGPIDVTGSMEFTEGGGGGE